MTLISIMRQPIVVMSALSTLGAAMPAATPSQPGCLQPEYNGMPGCYNDTTAVQGSSRYKDGQGVFIGGDCEGYSIVAETDCWTEWFVVGTSVSYKDPYQIEGDIDCPTKQGGCTQQVGNTVQSCSSFQWGLSESVSASFTEKVGLFGTGIESQTGFTFGSTQSWTQQSCNSNATTQSCNWQAPGCYSIWARQRIETIHGYARRRCRVYVPDQHDVTIGMLDYAIPLEGKNDIDCNGSCDTAQTVFPTEKDEGALSTWPVTSAPTATPTFVPGPYKYFAAAASGTTITDTLSYPTTLTVSGTATTSIATQTITYPPGSVTGASCPTASSG